MIPEQSFHSMKTEAENLGTRIRSEDGIGLAIEMIEQHLRSS